MTTRKTFKDRRIEFSERENKLHKDRQIDVEELIQENIKHYSIGDFESPKFSRGKSIRLYRKHCFVEDKRNAKSNLNKHKSYSKRTLTDQSSEVSEIKISKDLNKGRNRNINSSKIIKKNRETKNSDENKVIKTIDSALMADLYEKDYLKEKAPFVPHLSFAPTRFHRQPQFKMICSQISPDKMLNNGELISNVISKSPELLLLLLGTSTKNQVANGEDDKREIIKAELINQRAHSAEDLK